MEPTLETVFIHMVGRGLDDEADGNVPPGPP
jgi:hypothetical protein